MTGLNKKDWFIILIAIAVLFFLAMVVLRISGVNAKACKRWNANCANASDMSCCAGLSCQHGLGGWKCRLGVTPTPTSAPTSPPMPTPTPEPTAEPTPEPTIEPTPEPTVEPTPTPTPVDPCAAGNSFVGPYCGWSPNVDTSGTFSAPTCEIWAMPKAPLLQHFVRLSPTSVNLGWWPVENADHYALVYWYYGEDKVKMGVPYIPGNADGFTINELRPNTPINAQLYVWKDNCSNVSKTIDP